VKKAFFGMLASLMLAGALSAASSLTSIPPNGMAVLIGEGTSPKPLLATPPADCAPASSCNR